MQKEEARDRKRRVGNVLRMCGYGWKRKVTKNGCQFQTVDALREAIFTTWSNVPISLLETLASGMPKGIFEVINKKVGATVLSLTFLVLFFKFFGGLMVLNF